MADRPTGEINCAQRLDITGVFFIGVVGETVQPGSDVDDEDNIRSILEDVLPWHISVVSISGIELDNYRDNADDEDDEDVLADFDVYVSAELSGFEFSTADVTGDADTLWELNVQHKEGVLAEALTSHVVEEIADANLVNGNSHGISFKSVEHVSGIADFVEAGTDDPIEEEIHFARSY